MATILISILIMGQLSTGFCYCRGPRPGEVIVRVPVLYVFGTVMILITIAMIYLCIKLYKHKRTAVQQRDIELLKAIYSIVRKNEGTQTENSKVTEIAESKTPKIVICETTMPKIKTSEPNTSKTEVNEIKVIQSEISQNLKSDSIKHEAKSSEPKTLNMASQIETCESKIPKIEICEPNTDKCEISETTTPKTEINDLETSKCGISDTTAPQTYNKDENKTPIPIKRHLHLNINNFQKQQIDRIVAEVLTRKAKRESGSISKLISMAKRKSGETKSVNLSECIENNVNTVNVENLSKANKELESASNDKINTKKDIDDKRIQVSNQKKAYDISTSLIAECDEVYDTLPKPVLKCNNTPENLPEIVINNDETYDVLPKPVVKYDETYYDTLPKPKQFKVKQDNFYCSLPKLAVDCEEIYDIPNRPVKPFNFASKANSDDALSTSPNTAAKTNCNVLSANEPGSSNISKNGDSKVEKTEES